MFYKVELIGGNMTIVEAKSIRSARKWAWEEYGRYMEPRTTRAKGEDVDWCKMMGGAIHKVYS